MYPIPPSENKATLRTFGRGWLKVRYVSDEITWRGQAQLHGSCPGH